MCNVRKATVFLRRYLNVRGINFREFGQIHQSIFKSSRKVLYRKCWYNKTVTSAEGRGSLNNLEKLLF